MVSKLIGAISAVLMLGCGGAQRGDYDPAPPSQMLMYRNHVPDQGVLVMYAYPERNTVQTLAYTAPGGNPAVDERMTELQAADVATFNRLFTRERVDRYREDHDPIPVTSGTTVDDGTCPAERRVCARPPSGGAPACLCMALPGSNAETLFEVEFSGVGEAPGNFRFRRPRNAYTVELLELLERMRQEHHGN